MSTESEYPAIYGMESCDEIVNDVDRATIQFFSWNNGHSLYAINVIAISVRRLMSPVIALAPLCILCTNGNYTF